MYMGFADSKGMGELEKSLADLKQQRDTLARKLTGLAQQRNGGGGAPPASPAEGEISETAAFGTSESQRVARELEDGGRQLTKLDKQITARSRALPLFRAVVASEDLAPALRSQREHPMHTLLRRLYHEGSGREGLATTDEDSNED
jgi:hypothetical protein